LSTIIVRVGSAASLVRNLRVQSTVNSKFRDIARLTNGIN